MRRSKKENGVLTASGWRITEAGRHSGPIELRAHRVRRNQSLLWALRLLVGVIVLVGVAPYLRDEVIGSSVATFLNARSPAPINPGDHNGLLRK